MADSPAQILATLPYILTYFGSDISISLLEPIPNYPFWLLPHAKRAESLIAYELMEPADIDEHRGILTLWMLKSY